MSDFINFVHREENARAKTDEERLAIFKRQQKMTNKVHTIEDDDEFYDEDLNEAIRVQPKVQRTMPRKPMPVEDELIQEPKYCVPKPTRQDVIDTENDIKQAGIRPTIKNRELDFDTGLNENIAEPKRYVRKTIPAQIQSFSNNPVLSEATKIMNEMKKKIEDMFYQYGMTGLKKLNESMLDAFEDILNPPVREPKIYNETYAQPKPNVKRKVIKKKPVVLPKQEIIEENKLINEPVNEPTNKQTNEIVNEPIINTVTENRLPAEDKMPAIENEQTSKIALLKQKKAVFDELNNTANLSDLGNYLNEQKIVQQTTESEADLKLKRLNANVERLKKSMENSNKTKIVKESADDEPYEQPEEFDIVEDTDSTDIDLENVKSENEEN